jgi:hypothetical protein
MLEAASSREAMQCERDGIYIYISSGEDPKMSEKQFLNRR